MSNSSLIKKVKDAEKKAAEMRMKAMEDSRMDIRHAEEDTSKEKEQLLKDARMAARQQLKEVQEKAKKEAEGVRETEIEKNSLLKSSVEAKLGMAVKYIIDNARKGIG